MKELPEKLIQKLQARSTQNALRTLPVQKTLTDFSSNDYLGFATSETIFRETHQLLTENNIRQNGATGSRLLSGNHKLYETAETMLCTFHKSEAALIFNSGYSANSSFFSCIPQRGALILYDEYIHASIRDGITMSNAKAYKFKHNDLEHLNAVLNRTGHNGVTYIVTESVFSMDGDSPDLHQLVAVARKYNAFLIVDEAHAVGVFGKNGSGLIQHLNLENEIFARIITFGKAAGCHGAAVLGSNILKTYLVNFARSLIYTTALSPHAVATILTAYQHLKTEKTAVKKLKDNINFFNLKIKAAKLDQMFIKSHSAIHSCVIPGNEKVKHIAHQLHTNGFDVKPILSPTVPKGEERLRFCLHSYNTTTDMETVINLLSTFVV
ncbi:MAG: 8-amino-7-oxononanoate synthase [Bacteroidota bacterium]